MKKFTISILCFSILITNTKLAIANNNIIWHENIQQLEAKNIDKSGIYVLEKGEEALISRAWLVDNAKQSIDIQYFIWSTDNIGTLAAAALLRAANRGVHVRVIVDDLLVDAENEVLYALAIHPKIEIKIYNPNLNIGTSFIKKVFKTVVNFREVNQRMHNKVIIVDKKAVITGGRNMADEYFDFDHHYNFRDRDALIIGKAVKAADISFNQYWNSEYVETIEKLITKPYVTSTQTDDFEADDYDNKNKSLTTKKITAISNSAAKGVYNYLQEYEADKSNFDHVMRKKINDINKDFLAIIDQLHWVDAQFVSDLPGKNNESFTLRGGSLLTKELGRVISEAKSSITIQSPYLVMSWDAWNILRSAVKRGVNVSIITNSLSSTDNLLAYSGYARQRNRLLNTGFHIFEFKPNAKIRTQIINRYADISDKPPIFAIHAKSMVIDSKISYIGSFNFDPRSENLNTEAGVIISDTALSTELEDEIKKDMLPENSWNVSKDGHSHDAGFAKKAKIFLYKLIPMDAIL